MERSYLEFNLENIREYCFDESVIEVWTLFADWYSRYEEFTTEVADKHKGRML